MPYCGPVCSVASCASAPTVGFGSAGSSLFDRGVGYGYGHGYGLGGGSTPSANLGVLSGVVPSCINQLPPSECVLQPSPIYVIIPGPIVSASCEPLRVGGYTPCAVGGVGISRLGRGFYGGSLRGKGIICDPCA